MKPRVVSKASLAGPSKKGKKAVVESDGDSEDDSFMMDVAPPPARATATSRRPARVAASSKKIVDLSTEGEDEQPTVEVINDDSD